MRNATNQSLGVCREVYLFIVFSVVLGPPLFAAGPEIIPLSPSSTNAGFAVSEFVQYTPDGKSLIIAGTVMPTKVDDIRIPGFPKSRVPDTHAPREVKVWTYDLKKKLLRPVNIPGRKLTARYGILTTVVLSADGKHLTIWDADHDPKTGKTIGWIAQLDITTGKRVREMRLPEDEDVLAVHPSGPRVLSTVEFMGTKKKPPLRLWDVSTKESVAEFPKLIGAPAQIAADGNTLVFGTGKGAIVIWDVSANKVKTTLKCSVDGIASFPQFSPHGRLLAAVIGEKRDSMVFWNVESGKEISVLKGRPIPGDLAGRTESFQRPPRFSSDEKTLAAIRESDVVLVNTNDGKVRAVIPAGAMLQEEENRRLNKAQAAKGRKGGIGFTGGFGQLGGFGSSLNDITFSPDGKSLAAAVGSGARAVVFAVSSAKPDAPLRRADDASEQP